jgi:phosphatidylserine decarboxylase
VAHVPDLFARNERLLCYIDGPLGRVAVVAVGAYNVGRISAAFDAAWNAPAGASAWVTNRRGLQIERRTYDPPVPVDRGDELMTFHLGSTVVLVFEPAAWIPRRSSGRRHHFSHLWERGPGGEGLVAGD